MCSSERSGLHTDECTTAPQVARACCPSDCFAVLRECSCSGRRVKNTAVAISVLQFIASTALRAASARNTAGAAAVSTNDATAFAALRTA